MSRRSMKFMKGALERLPAPSKRWSKEKQKEVGQYVLYHDTVVRALCVSVASSVSWFSLNWTTRFPKLV